MTNYKEACMAYLDAQGIKYQDRNDHVISVGYSCENIHSLDVYLFFDKDGDGLVQLSTWGFAKFSEKNYAKGLISCNEMNSQYRWVKFYLDSDRDVFATIDARIDMQTVGEECYELIRRMVNIVDNAYPVFMKAVWG